MAKPISFPQQNTIFGKGQEEYQPLPAFRSEHPHGHVVTCWELDEQELAEVARTGRIYLTQMTFKQALQPVRIDAECPLVDEINAPHN